MHIRVLLSKQLRHSCPFPRLVRSLLLHAPIGSPFFVVFPFVFCLFCCFPFLCYLCCFQGDDIEEVIAFVPLQIGHQHVHSHVFTAVPIRFQSCSCVGMSTTMGPQLRERITPVVSDCQDLTTASLKDAHPLIESTQTIPLTSVVGHS